jgi:hypothetical protein
MRRRPLVIALAASPLAAVAARAQEAAPSRKVSAATLHDALSARFPQRLGVVGVLELRVSAPHLLLLPARNKLGATLLLQAQGASLRQPESGEVDLVFALRYEATDRSLRAHEPEVLDLRVSGLSADGAQVFRRVLPRLAREAMGDIVLHRFTPRELALADTLGIEPDAITVEHDGIVVGFVPKPSR